METAIIILYFLGALLSIIMIVKFFQLCSNIKEIKDLMEEKERRDQQKLKTHSTVLTSKSDTVADEENSLNDPKVLEELLGKLKK